MWGSPPRAGWGHSTLTFSPKNFSPSTFGLCGGFELYFPESHSLYGSGLRWPQDTTCTRPRRYKWRGSHRFCVLKMLSCMCLQLAGLLSLSRHRATPTRVDSPLPRRSPLASVSPGPRHMLLRGRGCLLVPSWSLEPGASASLSLQDPVVLGGPSSP